MGPYTNQTSFALENIANNYDLEIVSLFKGIYLDYN